MKAGIILASFIIYSMIGFIYESLLCSIREKKFIKRGLCFGPYCPIYGFCAIVTYMLSYKISGIFWVFLIAVAINSVVEYVSSFFMDKSCGFKLWDYSWRKYNLNGRICLAGAVGFGIASTAICRYVQPVLEKILFDIPETKLLMISIALCMIVIFDMILSLGSIKFFEKIRGALKPLF